VVRPNPDEQIPWDRSQSPTIVRVAAAGGVAAADGSFHWGDAGIGAGGALVLLGLGLAATLAVTIGRRRHTGEQHAIGTN
jgi:hypothetical protein